MKKIRGNIAKRIRMVRDRSGLTQTKFGEECGVSQQHIYFLEASRRVPSLPLIIAMAAVFMTDEHWLFTGKAGPTKRRKAAPTA